MGVYVYVHLDCVDEQETVYRNSKKKKKNDIYEHATRLTWNETRASGNYSNSSSTNTTHKHTYVVVER